MMYATAQDFVAHFGPREATMVSDRARTGEPDMAELARLIALACAEADGYIGRRYALPLTGAGGSTATVPQTLQVAVLVMARYHATGTEVMATEDISDRYKATVRWLEKVADGKVLLALGLMPAATGGPAPTGGAMAARSGDRMFGSDVLRQAY